jgi:hypothetical protein
MKNIQLGLKENWKQFTLLVIINAFVGGMVGMERSILPKIADVRFHIAVKTAILSFIIVFGIVKTVVNYFTGTLANVIRRKNLFDVSTKLGLDCFSEYFTWNQPGINMVGYSDDED